MTAHTHEGLSLSRYVLARLLASWPGGIGMSPWIGPWLGASDLTVHQSIHHHRCHPHQSPIDCIQAARPLQSSLTALFAATSSRLMA